MSQHRYSMSFTVGGLFHGESLRIAALYLELRQWNACRDEVLEKNLLQARTLSSLKRIYREAASRLETLTHHELEFLIACSRQDQAYLLWLAVCRRYQFIADFAIEVLRERHLSLKSDLATSEFDSFFNRKSEWHLELDEITPTTRGKLRQVLYKILREADLVTANNMINAAMPSPKLVELIRQSYPSDLLRLPVFESEITGTNR